MPEIKTGTISQFTALETDAANADATDFDFHAAFIDWRKSGNSVNANNVVAFVWFVAGIALGKKLMQNIYEQHPNPAYLDGIVNTVISTLERGYDADADATREMVRNAVQAYVVSEPQRPFHPDDMIDQTINIIVRAMDASVDALVVRTEHTRRIQRGAIRNMLRTYGMTDQDNIEHIATKIIERLDALNQ